MSAQPTMVKLNVGGVWYTTTRSTLLSTSGSLFEKILQSKAEQDGHDVDEKDQLGYYFIDRDGGPFNIILNYLRTGELHLTPDYQDYDKLICEARFYKLATLINTIKRHRGPKREGKFFNVVEVVEAAHPEKVGVCRARLTLTEELHAKRPFCDIIPKSGYNHPEVYYGPTGRFWIQTNKTRLKWAELLKAHGWYFMGSSAFCRKLPDITGEGTDLCHVIEKWCLVEEV